MGAWAIGGITLTGHGEPERVDGAWISASLFPTLGVQPLIGRGFLPEEDQPKVENAVLLSYGLWQRKFAGDRSIVGRSMNVNGKPRTVVGIMPAGFRFPEAADIWGTLSLDPKENPAHGSLPPAWSGDCGPAYPRRKVKRNSRPF